jgi:hypothetical protein
MAKRSVYNKRFHCYQKEMTTNDFGDKIMRNAKNQNFKDLK